MSKRFDIHSKSVIALVFSTCLAGCTPYLSSSSESANSPQGIGFAYYLPMRLVLMTYEYKNKEDISKLGAELQKISADLTDVEKRLLQSIAIKTESEKKRKRLEDDKVPFDSVQYLEVAKAKADAEVEEQKMGE